MQAVLGRRLTSSECMDMFCIEDFDGLSDRSQERPNGSASESGMGQEEPWASFDRWYWMIAAALFMALLVLCH